MPIAILSASNEFIEDIRNNLETGSFQIFRGVDSLKGESVHAVVVDVDVLEAPDSIQFYLSKLRKKIHDRPVLIVLRVKDLDSLSREWFMNDFILYPFRKGELQARLRLLTGDVEGENEDIAEGNIRINLAEYSVYLNDEKLELTYKEFELLRLFFTNRGVVFSRKEILNRIWGVEYIGGTRTVDVHIRRLRVKLGEGFDNVIETVRNVGYRCRQEALKNNLP